MTGQCAQRRPIFGLNPRGSIIAHGRVHSSRQGRTALSMTHQTQCNDQRLAQENGVFAVTMRSAPRGKKAFRCAARQSPMILKDRQRILQSPQSVYNPTHSDRTSSQSQAPHRNDVSENTATLGPARAGRAGSSWPCPPKRRGRWWRAPSSRAPEGEVYETCAWVRDDDGAARWVYWRTAHWGYWRTVWGRRIGGRGRR